MIRSFFSHISTAALLLLILSIAAASQDLDDVTLSGRVTDSNGLAVVGATVTAISVETGLERSMVTDDDGRYRIIKLKPGAYKIKVVQTGFGTQETPPIATISAQNLIKDFTLLPAGVTAEQTVQVTDDDSPIVDTTRTLVGGAITEREIEELPNSSRNALDFIFTLGGVAEEPLSTRDLAEDGQATGVNQATALIEGGLFSLSGGAAYSNNITIDGLDNNDDRLASDRFQPSLDSIAEVQVITNQFSAEYGRASGGRVNIRTRAGSNRFRGRAYMYFRDESLNANTYNNNRRNIDRLEFTEYTPGFTLSGPIPFGYFKNKTYFFSSYEHNNLSDTTLIDTVVPVAQNPAFELPPPTNPELQRTDVNASGALIAPYIVPFSTPSRNHTFSQRIDHNFTGNHNITFNYQFGRLSNFRQYFGSTRVLEDAIQGSTRNNDSFYFTDNYVFNTNTVNQFRYQFSKYTPGFSAENPNDPVVLIRVRDTAVTENRSGTLTTGNSTTNFASTRREKRHQFQDTLNHIVGSHTLKFGADLQLIESENLALGDATGTYNFDSVADFLISRVIRYRQNFGTNSIQKNTYTGVFIQDEWRAKSDLTISAGLRYERESVVEDNNNFGPRVGVAYAPFGNKTVFRAGAGIFYNRALLRTLDDYALGLQQQSFDSRNLAGPSFDDQCFTVPANANLPRCVFLRELQTTFPTPPTFDQLSALNAFSTPSTFTRRLDPNLKIPESYQFNFGFEHEIGSGIAVEANFTYNKTIRLWRETNVNAFVLPSGFSTYTDFLLAINTGTTRFELGPMNSTSDTRVQNGITYVNLNSTNRSTAANTPISRARAALAAQLNRGVSNSLGQIEEVGSLGISVYKGLILEMRRRFRQLGLGFGASFRAVYTLSRLRDDGLVNTSSEQIPGDFSSEFAPSVQDRTHRFAFSGNFETPEWLGKIRLSPIIRFASGNRFNLSAGGVDRNLDDVNTDRPNFSGNLNDIRFRNPGEPFPSAVLSGLSLPPIGTPGNLPRNAGRGPSQFIFDLNVSREFVFSERFRLRPNIEMNNVFNATVFTFSSDFINFDNVGSATFTENFLVPQRTLRQRQIRLGVRFDF